MLGSSPSEAWEGLLAERVNYVITIDPATYSVSPKAYNEALKPDSFRMFWWNLTTSGLFSREEGLPEDPRIAIFRSLDHVDHVALGRASSDQGNHAIAVVHLSRAASRTPNDIEVWANLQLAYERQGDFKGAIAAGQRALKLSPNHYYVNVGLARALIQQGAAAEGVARAQHAAEHAHGPHERASALALAAQGAFRLKDAARGCALLRTAAGIEADPEILTELEKSCGK